MYNVSIIMSPGVLQKPAGQGVRLLAVGDVHLGTRPGSLPDDLSAAGINTRDLTPAAALEGAVPAAIDHRVDAVRLAGDGVEDTHARVEVLVPREAPGGRRMRHGP